MINFVTAVHISILKSCNTLLEGLVLDHGSVNCLDPGPCCSDKDACVERGQMSLIWLETLVFNRGEFPYQDQRRLPNIIERCKRAADVL